MQSLFRVGFQLYGICPARSKKHSCLNLKFDPELRKRVEAYVKRTTLPNKRVPIVKHMHEYNFVEIYLNHLNLKKDIPEQVSYCTIFVSKRSECVTSNPRRVSLIDGRRIILLLKWSVQKNLICAPTSPLHCPSSMIPLSMLNSEWWWHSRVIPNLFLRETRVVSWSASKLLTEINRQNRGKIMGLEKWRKIDETFPLRRLEPASFHLNRSHPYPASEKWWIRVYRESGDLGQIFLRCGCLITMTTLQPSRQRSVEFDRTQMILWSKWGQKWSNFKYTWMRDCRASRLGRPAHDLKLDAYPHTNYLRIFLVSGISLSESARTLAERKSVEKNFSQHWSTEEIGSVTTDR